MRFGGIDHAMRLQPAPLQSHHHVGDRQQWHFAGHGLQAAITAAPVAGGAGVRLDFDIRAAAGALDGLEALALLTADVSDQAFARVFVNRRDVWLPTGTRAADLSAIADGPAGDFDADNLLAAWSEPDGAALLVGVVHPARTGLEIALRGGTLTVRLPLESGFVRNGVVPADPVVLLWDRPLTESLELYGRLNRIAQTHRRPPVAWNSWDYFTRHISQPRMEQVLEAIAAHPLLSRTVEAVVLDDCWARWGDWRTPYESFPDLPGLARRIAEAGYIPGIWYSPLRVAADSRWAAENPDTILWGPNRGHYATGLTREASRWALDCTHPKVLDKIYHELSWLRSLGFRYYKTDFLQAPNTNFKRPAFHDPSMTPVEAMRRAMETIRSAIGYDSWWLACGTEIAPLAGLPDAARVGDDIHVRFSTLQVVVRNCAAHFWANGALWRNDPDFLIVRGRETWTSPFMDLADDVRGEPTGDEGPYRRAVLNTGPVFTLEESRTWANFQIVYGGTLALSDHPDFLNEAGWAMVEKVLEHRGVGLTGVPLDLAERNLPQRWLRPAADGWLLGLFNFDDEPRRVGIGPRDAGRIGRVAAATDIWTGATHAWSDRFGLDLPAHHSAVLHLQRRG